MKLAFRFLMTCAVILVMTTQGSFAQISSGGTPRSFQMAITSTVPTAPLQTVDVAAYLAEDEAAGKDVAYRFGAPIDVSFNLSNSGVWTDLPDGGRLWRLHVQSPGAYSIGFLYDQWYIPEGADLFIYSDDRTFVIGAFTSFNNWVEGTNITQPVPGDGVTIEYYEPANVQGQGILSISQVVHAYRNIFGWGNLDNYGDSGSCNNNVNCPEGATWQTQKRGVAMILSGGSRICSGSLVNNVRQNQTPYFLTANHCLGGETSWVFMFNYESPTCTNANGPTTQTVANATLRATNEASDFALLQLASSVPSSYNPYFNGWNRVNTAATSSVGIHHPSGDIKKISFDTNAAVSDRYLGTSGVANSHWKITQWDDGTTEGGSSGSPLFDQNHRITGQLHGGYASCSSLTSDWYGKFSMSWDYGSTAATRLKDWLDPDNAAPNTLDGLDGSVATITVTAPNGGETLLVDDVATITWTSQNITENVKIELNRSYSGGAWETIIASTANDGSHSWTVTSPTTTAARVRISGVTQTTVTDVSNNNFTIAARSITVTAPNGGQTWYIGDANAITWTSQNLSENVKIELNRSYSGGAWETIIASTANDGSHAWTVTGPTAGAARVRISGVTHTTVTDLSDANFIIGQRTIAVTSPNGGEVWAVGTDQTITWTSQNVSGTVNVDLNRNYSGGAWEPLAAGIANSGSLPWTVTSPISGSARVRVTSVTYPVATDESDGNFTIQAANIPPVILHDPLDDQEPVAFTVTAKVTDDAGGFVTRFFYKLTAASIFDSIALSATGNPNEYSVTVGPLAVGSYDYFLRSQDVGGLTASTDTFAFEVGESCGTEQVYDDGVAEISNWSTTTDYRWAVRFDAGAYPYVLCEGRIGVSSLLPDSVHSPIEVQVLLADGVGDLPGTLVLTKTIGSVGNVIGGLTADPAAWATVVFRTESGDPLILEDDFYIAVSNPVAGKYEAFLHDTSSARAGRSVVYDPCEEIWMDELAVHASARPGNRLIRVSGVPLAPPEVVVSVSGNDIVLNWNDTGAPYYRIYSATAVAGPYTTVEGSAATNSFVDVGAASEGIKFYLVYSSTTP